MAEPLQTVFSGIRSRRPRIQFQPFEGFSGPNPGMRGTMPANALDTQDATDMAQGIDISSIAPPTRLQASQIMPALYQQPAGDEEGGEDPEPQGVQATPASYPMDGMFFPQSPPMCTGPNCQAGAQPGMMMAPMQATTLPPGVTLGPGETYVADSLREGPPAAAMATTAPQQLPAGAAAQKPADQLDPQLDPVYHLRQAEQAWAAAQSAAGSQQAALAMINRDKARYSVRIGQQALILRKKEQIATLTAALAKRGMEQQDRRLDLVEREQRAKTGELRDEIEQGYRLDRKTPVEERAKKIVRERARAWAEAGTPLGEKALTEMANVELGIITASDMSHYLGGYLKASAALDASIASGAPEAAQVGLRREKLRIDAQLKTLMRDRFGEVPQADLPQRMAKELLPVYEATFRDWFSRDDKPADEGAVQARALQTLDIHARQLGDMLSRNEDPMRRYMESVLGVRDQAPRGTAPVSQPAVTDEIQSSGTTPGGGILLNNAGTMSLAR